MTRREFTSSAFAAAAASKQKPNIVFFLSDDHGYFDSPVYGSKVVRTPNLDRIAKAGMVFTNAFGASPACVPSRAVIMSGLMPTRNVAEANHSGQKQGLKTMPTYLKECGYRVTHFGKTHFQPPANYKDMEFVKSEIIRGPLMNDLDPGVLERWLPDAGAGPVALFVNSHSPHVNWEPNEGYDPGQVELPPTFVDTPETRQWRARYYTDITKMDTQLGQVWDAVKKRLGDNTLFVYTSDNGAQWPFGKWNLYDAGIRLPMVAAWPGVIKPGTRTNAMVSFPDFLPTFVEAAGGRAPDSIDGRSFLGVLRGTAKRGREHVFATHSNDGDMNVYPIRCVRTERWKYILNVHPEFEHTTHIDRAPAIESGRAYFDTWVEKAKTDARTAAIVRRYHERPKEELYDVAADPHETRNLASDSRHAKRLDELRATLQEWMKQQGDEGRYFGKPRLLK
jgi:arylsulfatase A-like enzyme